MLRSESIASIQRLLAFRSDMEDEAIYELKAAQDKFERSGILCPPPYNGVFRPAFLLTEMAEVVVERGQERVPLPTDFLAESENDGFFRFRDSTEWKTLKKGSTKDLRDAEGSEPAFYARSGQYFRIFPAPEEVMYFRTIYYAGDVKLDTDIENKWLANAAALMIGEAGWHTAAALRDMDAMKIFDAMRVDMRRSLFMTKESAEHVNMRYVMGGCEGMWSWI